MIKQKEILSVEDTGVNCKPGSMFLSFLPSGTDPEHSHLLSAKSLVNVGAYSVQTSWILDRPYEEQQLLLDLKEALSGDCLYLSENMGGLLPYFRKKLDFFRIQIPQESFRIRIYDTTPDPVELPAADIYQAYLDFLKTGDLESLNPLFGIMEQELQLACRLYEQSQLPGITDGSFRVTGLSRSNTYLYFDLEFPSKTKPADYELDYAKLELQTQTGRLSIPYYFRTLKYFLPDYKQYYYIPEEDEAIHKSLAAFIEPKRRRRAKPETCYVKRCGYFIRQYLPIEKPVFQETYQDPELYMECTESFFQDKERIHNYVWMMIQQLMEL